MVQRTFILGFFCLFSVFLSGQTPKPYFLYLYDWGEGGPTMLSYKVDQINSINDVGDGYVFQLLTFCDEGNACQRFQKIDCQGNTIWEYDFRSVDTAFIGSASAQKNWVIDNKLHTLSRNVLVNQNDQEVYQYAVFDTQSGQLDYSTLHLAADLELRGLSYFYPYQDSLFLFGQSHEVEMGRNVPAFRIMNRQGKIIRGVNATSYFDNNTTLTTDFEENASESFNIITVQRDYFSTSAGFLYTGTCSKNGQKLTHHATEDHTDGQFPREVTFQNGNRFMIAVIDTLWDDIFNESAILKTYYLKPDGEIIWDSLHNTGDTTYYIGNVLLCSNGDALIVGEAHTDLMPFDNHSEMFLMRVNPQGKTIWHKKYSPYLFNKPSPKNYIRTRHLQEDLDGGILVTGNITRLTDTISGERERFGYILKLDENGCYGTDCDGGDILLNTKAPVFIDPLPPVKIYPNPTDTYFMIEVGTTSTYFWSLYNAQGHNALQGVGQGEIPLTIDIKHVPAGVYFLQIQMEEGFSTKQIIISR